MKRVLTLITIALVASHADASSRLTYLIQGQPIPIAWSAESFPIGLAIDQEMLDTLPSSDRAARNAFLAWEGPRTAVRFQQNAPRDLRAGRDGTSSVVFQDDLFKSSGFIAFTTTWFDDAGTIEEADIQFDPSLVRDGFNLQVVLQHEIGHFLGLDHSAVLSSTMYPFVARGAATPIDSDDALAMAELYPTDRAAEGSIGFHGEVRGQTGPLFGAHVVAINAGGAAVASRLTDRDGRFEINGLPPGTYKLYVEPLDGPVEPRNFSGVWSGGDVASFRTEFFDDSQLVATKQGESIETLSISVHPMPTWLNPRWIGTFAPQTSEIRLAMTVGTIRAGETVSIAVGGDGFVPGMTTFEVLGGSVTRVSEFQYGSNYLWATFQIAANIEPGALTVIVRNGDEAAALSGALRVAKPTRSHGARR